MAEFKSYPVPFTSRGVIQKKDPSLLGPGEYYTQDNLVSAQEGALTVRPGRDLATTLTDTILSIAKLGSLVYLIGLAGVYRWNSTTLVRAASKTLTAGSQIPYYVGSVGFQLIATDAAMYKADGTEAADSIPRWGILPPTRPAAPAVSALSPINLPTGLLAGGVTPPLTVTAVATSGTDAYTETAPVDFSRGGIASHGYDSPDPVHVVITLNNPLSITDIRIRLDVSTSPGAFTDYYEVPLLPSSLNAYLAGTQTALQAQQNSLQQQIQVLQAYMSNPSNNQQLAGGGAYDVGQKIVALEKQLANLTTVPPGDGTPVDVYLPKDQWTKVGAAGSSTQNWSALNAAELFITTKASATATVTKIELLGGQGPDASQAGSLGYKYCYTFRDPLTGTESNPSPLMLDSNAISPKRQAVAVTLGGTSDPRIAGAGSIAVYRAGGVFADAFYRLVGYATNPGNTSHATTTYTDTAFDTAIVFANQVEFDNDPPVRSAIPGGYLATISAFVSGSGAPGWNTITLSVTPTSILTLGTTIFLGPELEPVVIDSFSGSNIVCYLQNAHATGEQATCGSVCARPCTLVCAAHECVFLAGDAVNPHVLYQSKTSRPEAFPVEDSLGNAHQVYIGSPANPIVAITDYGNGVLCLNRQNLNYVGLWLGAMQSPEAIPSQRGLVAGKAWCKINNEVWYLSYDGVYSWSGGRERLRSYAIDGLFHGQTWNGYAPLDPTALAAVQFTADKNRILIAYKDTNGKYREIVYDLLEDRWHFDYRTTNASGAVAVYSDPATGQLLEAYSGSLYAENAITQTDATVAIPFALKTGFWTGGEPSLQKWLGDVTLELDNHDAVTVQTFYDFSDTADETITIAAAPTAGRRRVSLPIQIVSGSTNGREFYALSLRISGAATWGDTFYSATFNVAPLAQIQQGRCEDWDDLGYPYDKRLKVMAIEYDTKGEGVTVALDIIEGLDGNTQSLDVYEFTLSGDGRSQANLPILRSSTGEPVIAKRVRLRALTPNTSAFEIFRRSFDYEKYPPDCVFHTALTDSGWPFEKIARSITLDVDTGGAAVNVGFEVDGSIASSFRVTTTATDRVRIITVPSDIIGKLWRLVMGAYRVGPAA